MKTLIVGRYGQLAQTENASHNSLRRISGPRDEPFLSQPASAACPLSLGGDEDESAGTHGAGAVLGAVGGAGAGALVFEFPVGSVA